MTKGPASEAENPLIVHLEQSETFVMKRLEGREDGGDSREEDGEHIILNNTRILRKLIVFQKSP